MTADQYRRWLQACVMLALGVSLAATVRSANATQLDQHVLACIALAAKHHRVNPFLLRAVLRVESGLNPRALGRNNDGSFDIGIAQINSRHLPMLARHGIHQEHLFDPCVGAYVAAWHLSSLIAMHGNSWTSVARYHSAKPYFNRRYQLLLTNELIASRSLAGQPSPVPPLHQEPRRSAPGTAANHPTAGTSGTVWDWTAAASADTARTRPLPMTWRSPDGAEAAN